MDIDQLKDGDTCPGILELMEDILVPLDCEEGQIAQAVKASERPLPSVQPLVPEVELQVTHVLFREDYAAWAQCPHG